MIHPTPNKGVFILTPVEMPTIPCPGILTWVKQASDGHAYDKWRRGLITKESH